MKKYRKQIADALIEANVIKPQKITKTVVTETIASSNNLSVSSTGIQYDKDAVLEYLKKNNLPFTQEYVDMAAKMFQVNNGVVCETKTVAEYKTEVDDVEDSELDEYIKVETLEVLSKLVCNTSNNDFMSYAVETIPDKLNGATDVNALKRCLTDYANKGWHVKSIFTNELGKNAVSVGGIGVNSTVDQVVVIFERSMFLSDSKAKDIIEKNKLT